MSYKVLVDDNAVADLQRLPPPVRLFVLKSLDRLRHPEREGKPTTGLYAKGFLFELEYALGSLEFYIDVLFRYGPGDDAVTVFQVLFEYV